MKKTLITLLTVFSFSATAQELTPAAAVEKTEAAPAVVSPDAQAEQMRQMFAAFDQTVEKMTDTMADGMREMAQQAQALQEVQQKQADAMQASFAANSAAPAVNLSDEQMRQMSQFFDTFAQSAEKMTENFAKIADDGDPETKAKIAATSEEVQAAVKDVSDSFMEYFQKAAASMQKNAALPALSDEELGRYGDFFTEEKFVSAASFGRDAQMNSVFIDSKTVAPDGSVERVRIERNYAAPQFSVGILENQAIRDANACNGAGNCSSSQEILTLSEKGLPVTAFVKKDINGQNAYVATNDDLTFLIAEISPAVLVRVETSGTDHAAAAEKVFSSLDLAKIRKAMKVDGAENTL